MQCPACGYENIPEDARFCSRCRYHFPDQEPYFSPPAFNNTGYAEAESAPAEPEPVAPDESRLLAAMVLQPAILLMIFTATALYLTIGQIGELAFPVSGYEIRYGGVLCFAAGSLLGWIFYRVMLIRLE